MPKQETPLSQEILQLGLQVRSCQVKSVSFESITVPFQEFPKSYTRYGWTRKTFLRNGTQLWSLVGRRIRTTNTNCGGSGTSRISFKKSTVGSIQPFQVNFVRPFSENTSIPPPKNESSLFINWQLQNCSVPQCSIDLQSTNNCMTFLCSSSLQCPGTTTL